MLRLVSRAPGVLTGVVVDESLDAGLDQRTLARFSSAVAAQVNGSTPVFQFVTWSRMRLVRALTEVSAPRRMATHRSTVGSATPVNTATSLRRLSSAIHNTIRGRVATTADASRPLITARTSAA